MSEATGRSQIPMDHDADCAYQRDWPRDLDAGCERCRGLLAQKVSDDASPAAVMFNDTSADARWCDCPGTTRRHFYREGICPTGDASGGAE